MALALWRGAGLNPLLAVILATIAAGVALHVWSRAIEGKRRALDRTVTLMVTSAFAVAMLPLLSVIYTVVSRGLARFDLTFFTESARNVVGPAAARTTRSSARS